MKRLLPAFALTLLIGAVAARAGAQQGAAEHPLLPAGEGLDRVTITHRKPQE